MQPVAYAHAYSSAVAVHDEVKGQYRLKGTPSLSPIGAHQLYLGRMNLLLDAETYAALPAGQKKVYYLLQWLQGLPQAIKDASKVTFCYGS